MESNDLNRFLSAQEPCFKGVVEELSAGRKRSHWIWFIFPQRTGLGTSYNAQYYGLKNDAEIDAYINHEILGPRYFQCTSIVHSWLVTNGAKPNVLMGSSIDSMKLRSSLGTFVFACSSMEPKSEQICQFLHEAEEIAKELGWDYVP